MGGDGPAAAHAAGGVAAVAGAPAVPAGFARFRDEPPQMGSGVVGKSGRLRLGFEHRDGRTILAELESRAPCLAQRALHCDDALPDLAWLFMITTSGCVLQTAVGTMHGSYRMFRDDGFTGQRTFRWEPHITDYSAGPMQILSETARVTNAAAGLGHKADDFPKLDKEPSSPPKKLALYRGEVAIDVGAATRGHWSGCHAVGWDLNAPEFGDLEVGDAFQKHSYPLGIMVNADGERFVDEGADFRNYSYARYGREILKQPGQLAWQIFDAKVTPLLRDEYRIRRATRVSADDLQTLAKRLEGVAEQRFLEEIAAYNRAIDESVPFDPAIKDGRGTRGLRVPKSNWANRIDTPPFEAYGVTCGITFTFGGLHVDGEARVIGEDGEPIPGLFAAGELVGGLFYFNYPGGTGLTSGAVFGRCAGYGAARAD